MDCKRVRQVIFLYVDNEMGEELHVAFEEHMSDCPHCAQRIEYTRKWLTLVKRRCSRVPAPDSLRRRILTSLRTSPFDF
jgi:mycothiol system anti-sigma-R factor